MLHVKLCFFTRLQVLSNFGFKNDEYTMCRALAFNVTCFNSGFKNEVYTMCCAFVSLCSLFGMLRVDFR